MSVKHAAGEAALGNEKMGRLIFRMSLPTVTAQVVNLLYSMVDRIYIGHIPAVGSTALTGIGLTSPIIILITAFASFVGGGGAPLSSIALGQGDRKQAEKILSNGVTMLGILSVFLMILFYGIKEPVLYFIGASKVTFPYADDYLSIYLLGTLMVLLTVGLTPFLTAQGRSGSAMIAVLLGAAVNIVLDPVLIFLFDLGVKGAALATIFAQSCSACFVVSCLLNKKSSLRIRKKYLRPEGKILLKTAKLGVSPFVMSATESVIGLVMNNGLQQYGGDLYVGGLTVMQSVMQVVGVPVSGFQQGVAPILSYNYGAGNKKRVKEAFRYLFFIMFTYSFLLTLFSVLFPEFCASIFTDDAALIALVGRCMPIFLSGMLIFGIQRACQSAFVALGQAGISLFIALLRKVILLVPLALILPRFLGAEGIYLSEAIADATAATICGVIFLFRFRKILEKSPDRMHQ